MGFKLSELFVEITAPLDKLDSGLKEAQGRLEDAASTMGASASVDLGRSMTSGLGTSLAGLGAVIGGSFATALIPMQAQMANLGHIMRASAIGTQGAFRRLSDQLNVVLHGMDNIMGRHFDRELSRQIKTVNSVVWKRWLQGVQVMRRLQNQSEFTRATITRTVGAISGLNPFRRLRNGVGGFGIPDVGKIYSARFSGVGTQGHFAYRASQDKEFSGGLPKVGGGGIGGAAIGFGPFAAAGVAGTAAIATGMAKAASVASDFQETVSKVGVTFGDSAKIVEGATDDMAKKFGVPKREMMDAVSIFGLMAKGAGQSERAAADFGVGLSKLAMDASSFYNVGLDVALDKIRSGLSGESEPLRTFGVFLTEDAVKAEAARMGLARLGAELTEGQKIMARSSLIYKGLSEAQGDLERTQGGFANQSRELWGRLENLAVMAGEVLLPVFTELVTSTNDLLKAFEDDFSGIEGVMTRFIGFFKGIIDTVAVMYRNWDAMTEIIAIKTGERWTNVGEVFKWLGDVFQAFASWVAGNWKSIFMDTIDAILTALINLGENIRNFGSSLWDWASSWGEKPFELKFKPVMEGWNTQTSAFEAPRLKLSDFSDQIAEVENRVAEAEQEVADEREKNEKKADDGKKKAQRTIDAPLSKTKDNAKAEFVGIADFARKIQSGALDKDKIAKDHLGEAKKTNDLLNSIDKNTKKPPVAVAAGRK